jgi:hypothetical protein
VTRPRRGVALALALAVGAAGCGASLVNGSDRAYGYTNTYDVRRERRGSPDDVPVDGHQVTVRHGGHSVSGELLAASATEVVIQSDDRGRVRVPTASIERISIELYPSHGGSTALFTLGAMAIGVAGLVAAGNSGNNEAGYFLGGWGLVWLPLGLLVALPTAAAVSLSNEETAVRGTPKFEAVMAHLYEFARYPQVGHEVTPPAPPTPPPAPYAPPPPEEEGGPTPESD